MNDTPSTPAPTDAGALADRTVEQILFAYFYTGEPGELEAIKGAAPLLRKVSPQETRGGERTATITECINVKVLLTNIGGRSDDWIRGFDAGTNAFIDALEKLRTLATTLRGAGASMIDALSPSDLANWTDNSNCNAGIALAASQQLPRLEREGVASEVRKAKVHVVEQWEGAYGYVENAESLKVADAILPLLSPDTTVVSSTDPRAPYDVRFHENQIDQYETPVTSKDHP